MWCVRVGCSRNMLATVESIVADYLGGKACTCLKKNQSAPRPSEHPSVMGEKMSKRLGGIKGCKYKTSFVEIANGSGALFLSFRIPCVIQYNPFCLFVFFGTGPSLLSPLSPFLCSGWREMIESVAPFPFLARPNAQL